MQDRTVLDGIGGVYAALLVSPAVGLFGGHYNVSGRNLISLVVAAALVCGPLGTVVARTVDDLPDRLVSAPVASAAVLLPFLYFCYVVFAAEPDSTPALLGIVGLLAVIPGIGLPVGAAVIRNRRLRRTSTELAVVTVSDDESEGRNSSLVAGVVLVGLVSVGLGLATLFVDSMDVSSIFPALGGLSTIPLLLSDDSTEIAVTDEGLRIDQSFTRWSDLDGYRVTDDHVKLVRDKWYLPSRDFDRDDIDDEDALVDALSEFLPRLDEAGRVEVMAKQ